MTKQNEAGLPTGPQLAAAVADLRQRLDAVILAHYYQEPDIQDAADFVGDSLALAQQAARTSARVIVLVGVHFMAETAKILNPDKQVLLPDLAAGCSLADDCQEEAFASFLARHRGHKVITYINCSARIKALSDVVCTSSNAERIVRSFPADQPLVFAPDRHLGAWVRERAGRPLVLWPGVCEVHAQFDERRLVELKESCPDAVVAAHPECPAAVLRHADYVGSTSGILRFASETPARRVIVVTEAGIIHQLRRANPGKEFLPAPGADPSQNALECRHMKRNTLEKLYLCLRDRAPEIALPEALRLRALAPIQRMLELS